MEILKIKKAKIVRVGHSYGITIPKQFVTNGIVNYAGVYDVELKEVEHDGN